MPEEDAVLEDGRNGLVLLRVAAHWIAILVNAILLRLLLEVRRADPQHDETFVLARRIEAIEHALRHHDALVGAEVDFFLIRPEEFGAALQNDKDMVLIHMRVQAVLAAEA